MVEVSGMGLMIYWFAVFILAGVIVYQGWFISRLQKTNEDREKDMMNRIMVKDYATFVNGEIVKSQVKIPQTEPAYEEQGIPI